MTVSVKKQGLSIPEDITRRAGIKPGDLVKLTVRQGRITVRAAQVDPAKLPLETATKTETAAIRKGRAAYRRGEFVTLDQLHDELDAARRETRKKVTRKAS